MPKIDIQYATIGKCRLSKKEDVPGYVVTFEDGTVKETFLSGKALLQMLDLKTPFREPGKEAPRG